MNRKKGFIFIETLVVVAMLTLSLLATYSAYNGAVVKENVRVYYDDPAYMYRTYYISHFLKDFNLNMATEYLSQNPDNLLYVLNCNEDSNSKLLFRGREDNRDLCSRLVQQFHISNIYITKENLQALQNCKDYERSCAILGQIYPEEAADYLKTIGGKNKDNEYRIIIEYCEARDGSECEPLCDQHPENCNSFNKKICEYHYTTLSLGDVT